MLLLELTEEELDLIKKALAAEQELDEKLWLNEKEKKARLCRAVRAKLDFAMVKPEDELIKYSDFTDMVSVAKSNYSRLGDVVFISNKKVEENYRTYLCFVEAFTSWLNSKNLLKRLPHFDFTDKRW